MGQASPTNYFHVGLLRIGVQGSYGPVIPIDAASTFIDLPAGATTLGFSLFDTTNIRVTEQAAAALANVSRVNVHAGANIPTGGASVSIGSYTVPAGRMARLDVVTAGVAGAIADPTQAQIYIDPSTLLLTVYSASTTHASEFVQGLLPNPLTLFAGDVLHGYGQNFGSAAATMQVAFVGVEFDALAWAP